ncbi:MAG: DUF721 domain-containing protein [Candidatus Liberibacter ctenarytainae]|uniref:DUF721 domain-containing protein n=1 Tax=Candidatus Liberibacter ctenarytainae TaxID=2020335 RepID=A0A937DIW1_9HYPH|nr:DUF721 domain-containing protein [Candidatus Liberibacter ctenarytainae]
MMHFSEIVYGLLDPLVHRRTGISMSLIGAWNEIVGNSTAEHCKPEKIVWPSRNYIGKENLSGNIGGILVVACEGSYVLFLMHDQTRIIRNINIFFGFSAIKKMRIMQKSMSVANRDSIHVIPSLEEEDCRKIDKITEGIENESLKKSLIRFGRAVFGSSYL